MPWIHPSKLSSIILLSFLATSLAAFIPSNDDGTIAGARGYLIEARTVKEGPKNIGRRYSGILSDLLIEDCDGPRNGDEPSRHDMIILDEPSECNEYHVGVIVLGNEEPWLRSRSSVNAKEFGVKVPEAESMKNYIVISAHISDSDLEESTSGIEDMELEEVKPLREALLWESSKTPTRTPTQTAQAIPGGLQGMMLLPEPKELDLRPSFTRKEIKDGEWRAARSWRGGGAIVEEELCLI